MVGIVTVVDGGIDVEVIVVVVRMMNADTYLFPGRRLRCCWYYTWVLIMTRYNMKRESFQCIYA